MERRQGPRRDHQNRPRQFPEKIEGRPGGSWKLRCGFRRLQELKTKPPNEVLMILSSPETRFKEALEDHNHDSTMIALMLRCIAKALECESQRQGTINLLTMLESSYFVEFNILYFMLDLQENEMVKNTKMIKDIMSLLIAFAQNIPQYSQTPFRLFSASENIISKLKSLGFLESDLEQAFETFKEYRNGMLKPKPRKSSIEKQLEREDEIEPDNDFRKIPVCPQIVDVAAGLNQSPFLRRNKEKGKYKDLDHYLDVQFRLLREDFISPLRDGIQEYNTGQVKRLQDLRIYHDVQIISPICDQSGLAYRICFDADKLKRVQWESSKRLIYGSLVCLSRDSFHTMLFASVTNRDTTLLEKGIVDLRFENTHNEMAALPRDARFVMAETTAYFEAYKHVLLGLQNMRRIPFEKYIVRCETSEIKPPLYLRVGRANYDLRPLIDHDIVLHGERTSKNLAIPVSRGQNYKFSLPSARFENINIMDPNRWPSADQLSLDDSQFKAVQRALTNEFVITQGPPGTGKTYIGLKIVKALLHNHKAWNTSVEGAVDHRPMLIVCYTNHALDQFLEGILQFYPGDILRVGGRSSSELLKNHNLKTHRTKMRQSREIHRNITREAGRIGWELKTIKEEINTIAKQIEIAERELIHEDYLLPFMGPYYNELVQGFQQYVHHHIPSVSSKKIRNSSAIVEWLGYGTILQFENGNTEVRQEQLRLGPNEVDNQNVVLPDNLDEQVNVVDDVDRMVEMRQIEDEDEFDVSFLGNRTQSEFDEAFAKLQTRAQAIALNVSDIENNVNEGGWQIAARQKRNLKDKIRRELRSTNRMTELDFQNMRRVGTDVWRLSEKEKWRLYRYWTYKFCNSYRDKIRNKEAEYEEKTVRLKEIKLQEDQQIMRMATVIGMTTTGAAKYQSILQEIGPKIIVVEEAAEVLEAHIITTLSHNCEHLILIGDHKQLKPNPTVYRLAKDYNLDLSLFERMVKNGMECDCLKFQHRMRPTISKMMKIIYPELQDHPIVKNYPEVKGISENMYFVHHEYSESSDEEQKSHSNLYEAEYIVALCRYLKLQGYKAEQITILTLYSGQLFQLKKLMPRREFEGTRITVVDNFQGEENDIILLSTVRSNNEGKIGFLKIENRVCVALSRAKYGFYVIGNLELLAENSDLWGKVVNHAKKEKLFGEGLYLYCQNHPNDAGIHATEPKDFKKAPGGGCSKPCEYRLPCGHTCSLVCHVIDANHEDYKCRKPCQKRVCNIDGHRCKRMCYEPCQKCEILISKKLSCGHVQQVPCSTQPYQFKCMAKCEILLLCGHKGQVLCGQQHTELCLSAVKKQFQCGHSANVHCFEKNSAVCSRACGQELSCGHVCTGTCGKCLNGRLHAGCKKKCGRILVCGHICSDNCSQCPPCLKPCNNRCVHSRCTQTCGKICVKCVEKCTWTCKHFKCTKRCFEPCDRPRCGRPCPKILLCKHRCIGICGEPCPNKCRICNRDEITEVFFGTEDTDDALFVQLEDCGHIFEVTGLDRFIDTFAKEGGNEDASIKLIECPKCKTLIRRNMRYGNEVKKAVLDIEKVKEKITGDRMRIQRMRNEIPDKIKALARRNPSDAKAIREIYDKLFEMNVDENTLSAVTNQIEFLKAIEEIERDFEIDIRHTDLKQMVKQYCLIDLTLFRSWVLAIRKYFTEQELMDAKDEIHRLQSFRQFVIYSDRIFSRFGRVDNELERSLNLLKCGKKLNQNDKEYIKAVFKYLKKKYPASGLGVSEDEKVQIVNAMGGRKGHWFKCPNGHFYVIGDCGGATMESTCPECKATIGGGSHRLRSDNQFAGEMDGAQHPAWSEAANLANYPEFRF
uniref:NFX1-type zinc finger-containing protein 1-like n=1 Tax=Crassostrea virginica TaxID=6565 RepID=A0A8B8A8I3_CRAVI|nr:NFX1-type zinc finger-containing protein 1-like [Crassostrea virginica]XP_022287768.1 NFX1-type zinc finger-containing protein 1-like [Crassostrea virginica]